MNVLFLTRSEVWGDDRKDGRCRTVHSRHNSRTHGGTALLEYDHDADGAGKRSNKNQPGLVEIVPAGSTARLAGPRAVCTRINAYGSMELADQGR